MYVGMVLMAEFTEEEKKTLTSPEDNDIFVMF
jgi:hypothetical protein